MMHISSQPEVNSRAGLQNLMQEIEKAIREFKQDVPSIEAHIPQVEELREACSLSKRQECAVIGGPALVEVYEKVCALWDSIHGRIIKMEERVPDLTLGHLLWCKEMYPMKYKNCGKWGVFKASEFETVKRRNEMYGSGTDRFTLRQFSDKVWNPIASFFGQTAADRAHKREIGLMKYQIWELGYQRQALLTIWSRNQAAIEKMTRSIAVLEEVRQQSESVVQRLSHAALQLSETAPPLSAEQAVRLYRNLSERMIRITQTSDEQIAVVKETGAAVSRVKTEVEELIAQDLALERELAEIRAERQRVRQETEQVVAERTDLVDQAKSASQDLLPAAPTTKGNLHEQSSLVTV